MSKNNCDQIKELALCETNFLLKKTTRFDKYQVKNLREWNFSVQMRIQKGVSPNVCPLARAVKKFNTIIIAIITWAGFEFMRILTRETKPQSRGRKKMGIYSL